MGFRGLPPPRIFIYGRYTTDTKRVSFKLLCDRSDRLAQDDALRDFPERDHAPERDEKLAGERDDHLGLACCLWPFGSAAEPLRQGAVPLEQEEPPGELDQAVPDFVRPFSRLLEPLSSGDPVIPA